jgi:Helix-turn-helix domain
MSYSASFSFTASLIADPARAAILMTLLDGRALPAGELAYASNVTPQTASSHLAKLLAGGCSRSRPKGAIATIGSRAPMSRRRSSSSPRSVRPRRSGAGP